MHASQGTSDGQGHERFQRAGQERDTSGHLPLTESRWRGSLIHGERLAWVTARAPRTVFSRAVITQVFAANYKRGNEFLHRLIKLAVCTCTGRKQPLNLIVMRMRVRIFHSCNGAQEYSHVMVYTIIDSHHGKVDNVVYRHNNNEG